MRAIIYLMIGIILILSVGCGNKTLDPSDSEIKDTNSQNTIHNADLETNLEKDRDKIPDIAQDTEIDNSQNSTLDPSIITVKYFVDFSKKVNWEIAYTFMKMIDKPVKEISDDYLNWRAKEGFGGAILFKHPESEICFAFEAMKSLSDYYNEKLEGGEICRGFTGPMGILFPSAVWSDSISETEDYIKSYFGFDFEFNPNYFEGGCSYTAALEQNNIWIFIWSEDGLITPETIIVITGERVILD